MRNLIPSYIRVPVVFFVIAGIVEYFVPSGDQPAFMEQPVIMLFLLLVLFILLAIEGIVGSLDNILYRSLDEEAQKRYLEQKNKAPEFKRLNALYKKLLGSKPIEEEGEIRAEVAHWKDEKKIEALLKPSLNAIEEVLALVRFFTELHKSHPANMIFSPLGVK
jgi:hypothetical protein